MYAEDRSVFVDENSLANTLEGRSRPGHFRGVCTVVAKLFNILSPQIAVFGEKDFQQLAIIRRMVRDLNFRITILAVPTVRDEDGLAFSSRNQYLNAEERKQAPALRAALLRALEMAQSGEKSAARLVSAARHDIEKNSPLAKLDYLELVDSETLQPLDIVRQNSVVVAAAFFGKTRLIDNIRLA
jgi:pantoate--beta-alanine ligase